MSLVPCVGPEKDVVLITASLTSSPAISGNLSDIIRWEVLNESKTFSNFTSMFLMTV